MELLNKIFTAIGMIRNGQTKRLVAILSDKYGEWVNIPQNNSRYFFLFPIIVLEEIHISLDEYSLAYPLRDGGWQIVKLPNFSRGRQIQVITSSHHLFSSVPISGR